MHLLLSRMLAATVVGRTHRDREPTRPFPASKQKCLTHSEHVRLGAGILVHVKGTSNAPHYLCRQLVSWRSEAQLAFGAPIRVTAHKQAADAPERKYALGMVRQRLHQATFRCIHSATISAFAEDYAKITDAAYCVGVLARNIDLMKKECGHGFGGTDS